jgi:four helix bundle protein
MGRITQFRQLTAWQEAHKLVLEVYRVTKGYPSDERFGLVSQMRRAAVSVPANIAEGFKRPGIQEKIRFYNVTEGSLEEVKYFLILSKDLGYLASADDLISQAETVGRILHGLIASTERRRWRPILHTPYSILHTPISLISHERSTQYANHGKDADLWPHCRHERVFQLGTGR